MKKPGASGGHEIVCSGKLFSILLRILSGALNEIECGRLAQTQFKRVNALVNFSFQEDL
jgi:hypothetical protein